MIHIGNTPLPDLKPDEEIVFFVRKHWVLLALSILPVLALALLPFLIIPPFLSAVTLLPGVSTYFATIWFLVMWMILATIWTNHTLDIALITNKRLITVDQLYLFQNKVTEYPLSSLAHIQVEQRGLLSSLFSLGNFFINEETPTYILKGVPNPSYIQDIIAEQLHIQQRPQKMQ